MQLRDYQIDISEKANLLLKNYKIAYLSMQVRTGKTITALNTAKLYGSKKVLVITKKKAISSILLDYNNFTDFYGLDCHNYEQVHKLNKDDYDLIIIDEAHSLGQFPIPSERTKTIKYLCQDKPIIYLSGTPSPESYSQLFHQFWVSSYSPLNYPNFYKFAGDGYVTIRKKYLYNREINDYSFANKELIINKLGHLFISYSQEEAGFEQFVEEKIHKIQMNSDTYKIADIIRKDRVYIKDLDKEVLADTEVKLMQKLHQIYSGSVKTENGDAIIIDDTKIRFIHNTFKGQKIAIFYKFIAEKKIIVDFLSKFSIRITESPDEFNRNDSIVFISQIQSGREGLNLSTADCLVMYNIDFSAVSYWQGIARLQSKDRDKKAIVHWIFSNNGIEENIYKAVSNKKDYTLTYFKKDEQQYMVR